MFPLITEPKYDYKSGSLGGNNMIMKAFSNGSELIRLKLILNLGSQV